MNAARKEAQRMPEMKVEDVVFRQDLYPRIKHDQALAQQYSETLDLLPPIEVNQHKELIDGFHRWTGHKLAGRDTIHVQVTKTASDDQFIALAIERNATHGLQLSQRDKQKLATRLYLAKLYDRSGLKKLLSVSDGSLSTWLKSIDDAEKKERREKILEMWMRCYTAEEIAEAIGGTARKTVDDEIQALVAEFSELKKSPKVTFSEDDWTPPIYNVWSFGKKTNEVGHFGNSEQRIVDNLLCLYTEPFDIVVDPFAGGGSTGTVCRKRMRRYWISDRKPKPGMENDIRTLDVVAELPPLNKRWADVSLTYLDPPYWKQAEGQYSKDREDLANMPLDEFTESVASVVKGIASKQSKGVIALLIQPTQWKSEPKGAFTDHVCDIIRAVNSKKLEVENRISCPYQTEQYNAQQVEWAKGARKLLVITRELIVWRVRE